MKIFKITNLIVGVANLIVLIVGLVLGHIGNGDTKEIEMVLGGIFVIGACIVGLISLIINTILAIKERDTLSFVILGISVLTMAIVAPLSIFI